MKFIGNKTRTPYIHTSTYTMSSSLPSEVTLISEDGIKFQVRIQVVRCIGLFKNLLELHVTMGGSVSNHNNNSNPATNIPPLKVPNVNSLILDKIIEYLNNYTASKENSALTTKPNGLKVKNIISGIQKNNSTEDDEDEDGESVEADDDEADDDEDDGGIKITRFTEEDEFELKCNDENGDDENVFDFANFDEQSLKLFTPYEQNFFGSLDIPTLIEITKVRSNQQLS